MRLSDAHMGRPTGGPHVVLAALALVAGLGSPALPAPGLAERVREFTLNNGMRFLVVERHAAPTIGFALYLRTGSSADPAGRTGLAHLFEHLLFKGVAGGGAGGGESLTEDEFRRLYRRHGAVGLNAFTTHDDTYYLVSLPANRAELWFVLESARLSRPALADLESERQVVLEERRTRYDMNPLGRLRLELYRVAFGTHAYGTPVIGLPEDIPKISTGDAQAFYAAHYGPEQMVAAVVGDITTDRVRALAEKYFGGMARRSTDTEVGRVQDPPVRAEGERKFTLKLKSHSFLLVGYPRPAVGGPDEPELEVLAEVLAGGRLSRLNRELVRDGQVAARVWARTSEPAQNRGGLFVIGLLPMEPHTPGEALAALDRSLESVRTDGIAEEDLARAKTRVLGGRYRAMQNPGYLADALARAAVRGGWREWVGQTDLVSRVTAEDVKRAAATYLVTARRTVGMVEGAPGGAKAPPEDLFGGVHAGAPPPADE